VLNARGLLTGTAAGRQRDVVHGNIPEIVFTDLGRDDNFKRIGRRHGHLGLVPRVPGFAGQRPNLSVVPFPRVAYRDRQRADSVAVHMRPKS